MKRSKATKRPYANWGWFVSLEFVSVPKMFLQNLFIRTRDNLTAFIWSQIEPNANWKDGFAIDVTLYIPRMNNLVIVHLPKKLVVFRICHLMLYLPLVPSPLPPQPTSLTIFFIFHSLLAFFRLVFQQLASMQTDFSIVAWQPSRLNYWSQLTTAYPSQQRSKNLAMVWNVWYPQRS